VLKEAERGRGWGWGWGRGERRNYEITAFAEARDRAMRICSAIVHVVGSRR